MIAIDRSAPIAAMVQAGRDERTARENLDRRTGAAVAKLPAVLHRATHLTDRQLDDADRDELAGLPADALVADAGNSELLRADSRVFARAARGRAGRSLELRSEEHTSELQSPC